MAICLSTVILERTPTKHDVEGVPQPPKTRLLMPSETALALTMWGEARGESELAMRKVGTVVINRLNHPKYPKTVEEVVKQPHQFHVWDKSNPNYTKMMKIHLLSPQSEDWKSYEVARVIAHDLVSHGTKNKTWLFFSSHRGHTRAR